MSKIILVTGASSGIGKAIATMLASKSHIVYGASRSLTTGKSELGFFTLQMDVTVEDSVQKAITYIVEKHGKIDAVVNNAGTGFNGPAENISNEEALSIFKLNVLGAWNVCRAVLPQMRKQGAGHIISISSFTGILGLPYRSLYCSSKFALEGLMESMSTEVRQFGIHVSLIEPADFRTDIIQHRGTSARVDPVYADEFNKVVRQINDEVSASPEPEQVGKCVLRIINSSSPRLRYRIGPWGIRISIALKRILPDRMFERMIMTHYGIKRK